MSIRNTIASYWTSYDKIAETPDQWQLSEADYRALAKMRWVVTEKIHGAHFCIITDGSSIQGASRKQLLTPDDSFFQYQRVLQRLEKQVYQLFRSSSQRYPQLTWLTVYGELFGGAYPHPDVPSIAGINPVQTGIYYAPDIEFCAFDLAISGPGIAHTYLHYDQASELLQQVGLLYAFPLLIGSYQEALEYPVTFSSTLPARLGLPPLAQENNAEGIVIKPLKTHLLTTAKGTIRPILKRKTEAFAEDRRYHQAQKWADTSVAQTSRLEMLKWEAYNLVTENRLLNAVSKIGYRERHEQSRSRQLFQLFIADILEQLIVNQAGLLATLTREESLQLRAYIQQETRILFKDYFRQTARRV